MKFNNLMIDIETMSTKPNAAIVSVGLVFFNLDFLILKGQKFYSYYLADLGTQPNDIYDYSEDTKKWWCGQTDSVKKALTDENRISIYSLLMNIVNDINLLANKKTLKVWAKSPAFDCQILKHAFWENNIPVPWNYYNERCVRTLYSLCNYSQPAAPHNALNDAYIQAVGVGYCMNELNSYNS